jgi:TPR repeat protein
MTDVARPDGVDFDALVLRWTPAAEAGDSDAMFRLCATYVAKRDWDAAEPWARRMADEGTVLGMRFLAQIREERGDGAGAQEWHRRAQEAESRTPEGRSVARLVEPIVENFGEDPDPELLRAAAEAGDSMAMIALGMMLVQSGELEEAERWLTPGAEAGDTLAMFGLGGVLSAQGDDEAAERWLERAAESGEYVLMDVLGELAARNGDEGKARHWKDRAREARAAEVVEIAEGNADADPDADRGRGAESVG